MAPPPKHHYQGTTGEHKKHCAWFATRHFLDTDFEWNEFASIAAVSLKAVVEEKTTLQMTSEEADAAVDDGIDPAALRTFLPDVEGGHDFPYARLPQLDRVMICSGMHFFTILKIDGVWKNYDSLTYDVSNITGNISEFIQSRPAQYYYWAGARPQQTRRSAGLVDI